MLILIIGLILFFALHSLAIFAPHWRERTRERIGHGWWRLWYSLASLLTIVLIAWGYAQSRYTPVVIYVTPGWTRRVTDLLMLAAFPLMYATFLPGKLHRKFKYPDLVAIKIWAFAHLLVNGMLADLFLFGGMLAWAVINRISLRHRVRILPSAEPSEFNDVVAVVAGLVTYLFIGLFVHYIVLGVSPF